jgi:GTP-binding protein EngB required for normal cell division
VIYDAASSTSVSASAGSLPHSDVMIFASLFLFFSIKAAHALSKSARSKFETIIFDYCKKREQLVCLFVLIDSRLALQKIDLEFMLWCGENEIPFSLIYTKSDKNSKLELNRNIKNIEKEILTHWEELPNSFITSSEKKLGGEEVLDFIAFNFKERNALKS